MVWGDAEVMMGDMRFGLLASVCSGDEDGGLSRCHDLLYLASE